jgi:hypothetical protein
MAFSKLTGRSALKFSVRHKALKDKVSSRFISTFPGFVDLPQISKFPDISKSKNDLFSKYSRLNEFILAIIYYYFVLRMLYYFRTLCRREHFKAFPSVNLEKPGAYYEWAIMERTL